jgi:hypothetical protein
MRLTSGFIVVSFALYLPGLSACGGDQGGGGSGGNTTSSADGGVGGAAGGDAGGGVGAAGSGGGSGGSGSSVATGLEGGCAHAFECGSTYYDSVQDCVDAAIAYWGENCQDELDTFNDCVMTIDCEGWNPDAWNPALSDCADEWSALNESDC